MKRIKRAAVVIAVIFIFALPVYASSSDADGYLNDFDNLIPEDSSLDTENLISGVGIDFLLSEIFSAVTEGGSSVISFLLLLLGLGLAFSFAELLSGLAGARLGSAVRCGVSVVGALLIFSRLRALVLSSVGDLERINSFFSSLIPIVTGISLSGGAVNSASVQMLNMNITLSVLGKLSTELLMPIVFMIFAFALVSSAGEGGISAFAKGVRSVFMWALGILSAVLVAAISMQSFLATASDSAVLRAAKYAVSGSIPIVGSTVSGALATLSGSLREAGAVIGVGAVAVIFTMAASPIIIMLLYRAALSFAISVLEFIGAPLACGSFSAFRSALDSLISVYTLCALVYILEIAIFIRGGVSVFG